MFYVDSKQDAEIHNWSRDFTAKNGDMYVDCTIFFNEGHHDVPQIRANSIFMHGFEIHVGGGPSSHVDFPIGSPNGVILSEDVDNALSVLLGRLQGTTFEAKYPEYSVDDEDEEGFRW